MPIKFYRHDVPERGFAQPSMPVESPDDSYKAIGQIAQAAQGVAQSVAGAAGRREAAADQVAATKSMYDVLDTLDKNFREFERSPRSDAAYVDEWDKLANSIVKGGGKGLSKEAQNAFQQKMYPKLLEYRKKVREVSDNFLVSTGQGTLVQMTSRLSKLAYEAGSSPMGEADGVLYRELFGVQTVDPKNRDKKITVGGVFSEIDTLVKEGILKPKEGEEQKQKMIYDTLAVAAGAMANENPADYIAAERDPKHPRHVYIENLAGSKRNELKHLAEKRVIELQTQARLNEEYARKEAERTRNESAGRLMSAAIEDAQKPGADIPAIVEGINRYAPHSPNTPILNDTEHRTILDTIRTIGNEKVKGVDNIATVSKFVDDFEATTRRYSLADYTAAREQGLLSHETYKWFVSQDRAVDNQRRTITDQRYTEARREEFNTLKTLFGITPFSEVIGDPRHALWVEAQKEWNVGANRGTDPNALAELRADIEARYRPALKLKVKDQVKAIDVYLNAGPDPNIKEIMEDSRWKRMNRDQRDEVIRQLRLRDKLMEYQKMLEEKAKTGPEAGKPGNKGGANKEAKPIS